VSAPVNAEIGAALGRFFHGGSGPSHTALSSAFAQAGYGEDDPYDGSLPNKERRVQVVVAAATRRPIRARELVEAILTQLRVAGMFDAERTSYDQDAVRAVQRGLHRIGWQLDNAGYLSPLGVADVATGGRGALDEQLDRLRRASDDPALSIGTAKDLLEAVAKFVLEELSAPYNPKADFAELWYLARSRLGIHPKQVAASLPGASVIQTVMQSAWNIADSVNQLRNLQGTGHGRTLPTGVTAEMALLVVREACSIAEYVLMTLDRTLGRHTA
jgi:hypothetical protein